MISIVHPLSDELLGLIEIPHVYRAKAERDTSWRWMVASVLVIWALAWLTR